jgi:hypothetical protein
MVVRPGVIRAPRVYEDVTPAEQGALGVARRLATVHSGQIDRIQRQANVAGETDLFAGPWMR